MFLKIALLLSIIMQVVTALYAISLIKKTRYNVSWILLTLALLLIAFRRIYELPQVVDGVIVESPFTLTISWLGVLTSVFFLVALIFIRKFVKMINDAETTRQIMDQKVLNAVLKTEENERKRMAKELHDGLGPLLSNLKMSLSSLNLPSDENQQNLIRSMKQVVNESITSIREISNNLSPHILDNFGLLSALKAFTGKIADGNIIRFEIKENIANIRFSPSLEIAVYRVLCELINNTLKHAGATLISIRMIKAGNILMIDYNDNGSGFMKDQKLNMAQGMGFSNIVSRLKSVNCAMEYNAAMGNGFSASITCPLDNSEEQFN